MKDRGFRGLIMLCTVAGIGMLALLIAPELPVIFTKGGRGVHGFLYDRKRYGDDRKTRDLSKDEDLARVADELRLVKDDWEVGELQEACDITTLGFEDSVREWDDVLRYGERWLEGTFFRRARAMARDGETYAKWWDIWAAQEKELFTAEQTEAAADIRLG